MMLRRTSSSLLVLVCLSACAVLASSYPLTVKWVYPMQEGRSMINVTESTTCADVVRDLVDEVATKEISSFLFGVECCVSPSAKVLTPFLLQQIQTNPDDQVDFVPFPRPNCAYEDGSTNDDLPSLTIPRLEVPQPPAPQLEGGEWLPSCLLLHGLGQTGAPQQWTITPSDVVLDNKLSGKFSLSSAYFPMLKYWGHLPAKLLGYGACSTVYVFRTNTNSRSWDDINLQREYCNIITTTGANVIYTHSMGNVIIAAGIGNMLPGCGNRILPRSARDAPSGRSRASATVWIGSQGPLQGSAGAEVCIYQCRKSYGGLGLPPVWPGFGVSPASAIAQNLALAAVDKIITGQCHCDNDATDTGTVSLGLSYVANSQVNNVMMRVDRSVALNPAAVPSGANVVVVDQVAKQYLWGNVCGFEAHLPRLAPWMPKLDLATDPFTTKIRLLYEKYLGDRNGMNRVLGEYAPSSVESIMKNFRVTRDQINGDMIKGNDLMVPFYSCAAGAPSRNSFTMSESNPWMAIDANHKSGTGDEIEVDAERVRRWLINQVKSATNVMRQWNA